MSAYRIRLDMVGIFSVFGKNEPLNLLILPFTSSCSAYTIYPYRKHEVHIRQGVVPLTARERILMIRLIKKLEKHPEYAQALGIETIGASCLRNKK